MTWGKAPKPDVKDQFIAHLQEQLAAKDLRILDLEKQLLAVMKPAAYRQVHTPEQEGTEVVDLSPRAILSPRQIPAHKFQDEKFFSTVDERMRKAFDGETKQ